MLLCALVVTKLLGIMGLIRRIMVLLDGSEDYQWQQ